MKLNNYRSVFGDADSHKKSLFSLGPILGNVIVCGLVIAAYFYITSHYLFAEWPLTVFWGSRVLIAFNILSASARSLLAPVLTVLASIGVYFSVTHYHIDLLTITDAKQLGLMAVMGFIVTFLLRF
jgi:hypothetical protein